jgi:hypothetical protein
VGLHVTICYTESRLSPRVVITYHINRDPGVGGGRNMRVVQIKPIQVGFEALTAMVTKSTIFLDIMLCSPLKVN